jgi:NAD(P)-dependent dehydrogenase (short-subunit alcohol dehydrogenase family)
LGHFALTGLLLGLLNATTQARVVTVSGFGHRLDAINFEDLNWQRAYVQSKLANLLFTYELQRKLSAAGQGTLAVAAHPGWTATNLQQYSRYLQLLNPLMAQTTAMGALPTLYAAPAPEVRGCPQKVKSSARSHDAAAARRLWSISEALTQVRYSYD